MAVKFSVTFVDPEDGPKHIGDYSKFSLAKKVIKDQFNKLLDTGDRDRKSTRLNSSHSQQSRMPSSA